MKTVVSITSIAVGALLVAAPLGASQWQLRRAAEFYVQHGSGSVLPEEMRPRPYGGYDWGVLVCGGVMALIGGLGRHAVRVRPPGCDRP